LRQGIEDGFLAPYKAVRIDLDNKFNGVFMPYAFDNKAKNAAIELKSPLDW
jgi:type I site-specific restriction endonuclease